MAGVRRLATDTIQHEAEQCEKWATLLYAVNNALGLLVNTSSKYRIRQYTDW
jgi:hypothetical protein